MRSPRPAESQVINDAKRAVYFARPHRELHLRVADDVNVAMIRAQHLYDTAGPRNYREPLSFVATLGGGPGLQMTYLGMTIDVDPHLPRGVWRITDEHETLLFDCREEG